VHNRKHHPRGALPTEAPPRALPPRVLGDRGDGRRGPTLICIGSIHGNEPAGIHALRRVFDRLDADARGLQGRFLGLTGNRKAAQLGCRFIHHDLNRAWGAEDVIRLRLEPGPLDDEDEELRELDGVLHKAVSGACGPLALLDLHSTSGDGPAFVTLDDTLPNRRLASKIAAPHVLGLEEQVAGTLLSHFISDGLTAIGFEAGRHEDPTSIDRAEAAVWVTLETAGVLALGSRPEVAHSQALLRRAAVGLPAVVEVRHRHALEPTDAFRMKPGYRSFQTVESRELLGKSERGPVASPSKGLILMPLYQAQGDDGFFIVQPVRSFWLHLSSIMRHLQAERWAHWLPGVRRQAGNADSFVVDQTRARWLALELFHLLGFRRHSATATELVVSPRGRQL